MSISEPHLVFPLSPFPNHLAFCTPASSRLLSCQGAVLPAFWEYLWQVPALTLKKNQPELGTILLGVVHASARPSIVTGLKNPNYNFIIQYVSEIHLPYPNACTTYIQIHLSSPMNQTFLAHADKTVAPYHCQRTYYEGRKWYLQSLQKVKHLETVWGWPDGETQKKSIIFIPVNVSGRKIVKKSILVIWIFQPFSIRADLPESWIQVLGIFPL